MPHDERVDAIGSAKSRRLREVVNDADPNPSDLDDRALWDEFMAAYEIAITRCSTAHAPWHIIPADRNWVRNAIISRIVRETLEKLNPQYPLAKGWDPATVKVV